MWSRPKTSSVSASASTRSSRGSMCPHGRCAGTWAPVCPVTSPTTLWKSSQARKKSSSVPAIPCWNRIGSAYCSDLEVRPADAAHLGHRREAVVQLGDVAVGLSRVAPGDVDAHAPPTGRVLVAARAPGCRCAAVGSWPCDMAGLLLRDSRWALGSRGAFLPRGSAAPGCREGRSRRRPAPW